MTDTFNKLEYRNIPKKKLTGKKWIEKSVNIGDQLSQVIGIYYPYRIDNYVKYVRSQKFYGRLVHHEPKQGRITGLAGKHLCDCERAWYSYQHEKDLNCKDFEHLQIFADSLHPYKGRKNHQADQSDSCHHNEMETKEISRKSSGRRNPI